MQQGPVGSGFVLSFMNRAGLEKCALQGDIIPGLRQGPGHDTQLSRPVEVIGYGAREGANKSYGTRAFTGNPLILND